MQYAAPREGLERGRAQRAHRGADLSALLRQYLYFCTSKASKPSTCWRRAPWRSSAPRGEPAAVGTTRRRCASGGAAAPLAAPVFSTVARGQFHFFWHNMLGVNIACITSCVCIPRRRGNATGETAARLRRRRTCRPQTAPALEIYLQLILHLQRILYACPTATTSKGTARRRGEKERACALVSWTWPIRCASVRNSDASRLFSSKASSRCSMHMRLSAASDLSARACIPPQVRRYEGYMKPLFTSVTLLPWCLTSALIVP